MTSTNAALYGTWIGVLAGPDTTQRSGWSPECRDSVWVVVGAAGIDFHMSRIASADTSLSPPRENCFIRYPAALNFLFDPKISFRVNFSQRFNLGSAVPFEAVRSGNMLTGSMTIPGDTLAGTWTANLCTTCPSASVTTSIAPATRIVGSPTFGLTVKGSNFTPCSSVRIDGLDRVTLFVSATELLATITAADQAAAGTRTITVFTPTAGGGESNAQTLTLEAPPQ